MKLYGKTWKRREIERHIGRIDQVGGVKRYLLQNGSAKNVEQIQVNTGAGLSYCVNSTRGMDISLAEYCGTALTWQSPNGDIHPSFWKAGGIDWLKTAVGGLLMTCGLTQVGSLCQDGDEKLTLHGDAHQLPATLMQCEGEWQVDDYLMIIKGQIRQSRIFGENITLTRTIQSTLGENRIQIDDIVRNEGFKKTPHMLLYHFNFGFPLLTEKTQIDLPSQKVIARDPGTLIDGYHSWQKPGKDISEKVYYHEDLITENDWAAATIHQPEFLVGSSVRPITVRLSWDTKTLPRLVQWKMPGEGTHVLGIEPANCHVEGRVSEHERGTLQYLESGESRSYHLVFEVVEN